MSKAQKIKQIIAGAMLVGVGIVSVIATNDATAAVFLAPLGLYTIFTRETVVM